MSLCCYYLEKLDALRKFEEYLWGDSGISKLESGLECDTTMVALCDCDVTTASQINGLAIRS